MTHTKKNEEKKHTPGLVNVVQILTDPHINQVFIHTSKTQI